MGTKMAKFTYFKTIKAWDCAIFFQNRVKWQHLSHLSLSGQNPLQMILVLVLCKTLTPPLATDHLSSNCIDPFLKMFLYPLLACCQMEQAPWNCRRFNSNQHFHKFPLTTTSPKLGARQKLWKCFWRLNANVRFQIELKHFALTIATKNVYNQKYFQSMRNRLMCTSTKNCPNGHDCQDLELVVALVFSLTSHNSHSQ